MVSNQKSEVKINLQSKKNLSTLGECVTFDNLRVLHGRKGFEATKGSSRLYHGSYLNWCEIKSRMNTIKFLKQEMEH